MENGVAWIFKTLIKVPVIIAVSFLILNIFAFTVSYFRVVGAANTLQRAVMDNNFLTTADKESFEEYLKGLETSYLTDIHYVINTDANKNTAVSADSFKDAPRTGRGAIIENKRRQYGNTIDVGIVAQYKFILPLQHVEMVEGGAVAGFGGMANSASGRMIDASGTRGMVAGVDNGTNSARASKFANTISVVTRVIGMQYYSDLDVNR